MMANSVDIFKALCDGLITGLEHSAFSNDMWFRIAAARCGAASELCVNGYDENTRDKCIAMYTASINDVIMEHPEAIAALPEIKTLFQAFYKAICNQIKPEVFHPDIDGLLVKQWIENNQAHVKSIITRLPDPPQLQPVVCGNNSILGGVMGLAAMHILKGMVAPLNNCGVLIPVATTVIGGCFAYLDNTRKLQAFKDACSQTTSNIPALQVIAYSRTVNTRGQQNPISQGLINRHQHSASMV
jgi:hypothetical protein